MRDVKIKICDVRDAEVAKYCEQQGVCFLGIHQIKYPYDMYLYPGIISVVDIDNIEEYDLEEPRSDDIKYISKYKVMEAYRLVNKPCISLDCGFWIDELDGFPRAFVNFALNTIGIDGMLKLMENKENRNCRFTECLSYYDGNTLHQFMGKHEGSLSKEALGNNTEKKWSDLWYIFKPFGYDKTLAQMYSY